MKIVIAPDKFKGSLTSFTACQAITAGIRSVDTGIDTIEFPMADGGDGFAAVMKHYLATDTIACITRDPLGRTMSASYQLDENNRTAIIEMASASGLVLLKDNERSALNTSSLGTGLMIKDAIRRGVKKIILGLGGSATTDAGTGILAALGFELIDKNGHPLQPTGRDLHLIDRIAPPPGLPDISFELACDVQNVLYGPNGAAHIYGPQKGATHEDVLLLDAGLRHFAKTLHTLTGREIANIPGTGAAGGIPAALIGFFNVRICSGVSLVIQAAGIAGILPSADMLITGEGKIDGQTAEGKVVSELARMAAKYAIPLIAFCGMADRDIYEKNSMGLQTIRVISPDGMDIQEAMKNAATLLKDNASAYFRSLKNTMP